MGTMDRINRARWSRDQMAAARRAAVIPSVEQERAEKLSGLRRLAEMMESMPHMAGTLANVRAEIARLEH